MKLAPSSIKITRGFNDPNVLQDSLQLSAARGEFEALQLVVDPDAHLEGAEVSVNLSLSGHPTVQLPQGQIRTYRLTYLDPLDNASSSDVAQGEAWPDPLIPLKGPVRALMEGAWSRDWWTGDLVAPSAARTVDASQRALFWVELFVPLEQQPGQYSGSVTLEFTGGTRLTKPLSLLVHDFALPLTSSLKSMIILGVEEMCRAHGDVDGNNYCNEPNRWAWLYGRLLLEHRLTPSLPHKPVPSAGMVDIDKSYNDLWQTYGPLLDGSDADLALRDSRGRSAKVSSLNYPWWISEYDHKNEVKLGDNADNPPRMQAWQDMVRTKLGLTNPDRLTLAYLDDDEPGAKIERWENVNRIANVTHNVSPRLRHLVTTDLASYQAQGGVSSDKIDVLSPMLLWLDDDGSNGFASENRRTWYNNFLAYRSLNELWSYQSCNSHGCEGDTVNRPNLMVDATAIQNRAEPWMHFIYGTDGMLYYNIAHNLTTAWKAGDGLWALDPDGVPYGGNGDGTLVYPGTPTDIGNAGDEHIPIASFRLKMLREGLEDYEYLRQCERVDPTWARQIASDANDGVFTRAAGTDGGTDQYPHGSMYRTNNVGQSDVFEPAKFVARIEDARLQLAECIASGSSALDPDWLDEQTIISPPRIVGPVMSCGDMTPVKSLTMGVGVSGIIPGAVVEIYADDPPPNNTKPILTKTVTEKATVFDVPARWRGTLLFARQTVNGNPSKSSAAAEVTEISGPDDVSRPVLHYYDFYACSVAALTSQNIAGAGVSVFSSSVAWMLDPTTPIAGPKKSPAPGYYLDFYFPTVPLEKGRWISAKQSLCGLDSDFYPAEIKEYPAESLPKPGIQDCDVYGETTQCVFVTGVQPGATYTVTALTSPSPTSHSGPAFTDGQQVTFAVPDGTAFTASQELCPGSGSGASAQFVPTRKPCASMPAPEVATPKAGDDVIEVTRSAENVDRFHVFAGADGREKVAESTDTTIPLVRSLVPGDLVRVFQSTANCRGVAYIPLRVPLPPEG